MKEEARFLMSTVVPGRGNRRLALAIVLASAATFIALVPFAKVPLHPVPAFIPAYQSALVLSDLITAVMLFSQYRILRSRAFAALATGYLFTASIAVGHALTFPGLFAPAGLLGAGAQSTAWLYMFWHGGFPGFVIIYALLKGERRIRVSRTSTTWPMLASIAVALAAATGCMLVATTWHDALPAIMRQNHYTPTMIGVVASVWALSLLALVVLWFRRPHSVLDVWLMVVMCAWLFDIALSAVLNAGRFDVGFYAGRIYGLLASSLVLMVLLVETARLHAQIAHANAEMQRKTAVVERVSEQLEREARERTRLIADLTQARADAEQASRAKSAFLATMSHEIRTPMNGVIGMVGALACSRLTDEQQTQVATIRESAATLLGIIDDILDFSKIEAGRLQIEQAPLSLPDLVEGICSSLVPVAAERGVSLDLFVSPDIPEQVVSDDIRLRQVLYNLIGNAIKFSGGRPDRKGRVAIRAEVAHQAPLRVRFSIADNGIGMAPDTLDSLFTPFTQAEVSTTRRFGGTGLGLTICKRLVDLMQGEIDVASTPGMGSTFAVTLPFAVPAEQPDRSLPDLSGIECALVDSADLAVETLRTYLERAGASVRVVSDVTTATRDLARFNEPTVVVAAEGARLSLSAAAQLQPHLRALIVRRGGRPANPPTASDVVTLDGDALRRRGLLHAVAVLVGRAQPDTFSTSADKSEAFEPATAPTVAEARSRGQLVLVAEDDAINQKVILHQLRLLGLTAEIANNGAEALQMWRDGVYAILLTDVHMPEMDGYTLTETIRREEGGKRRMPIVALSANALRNEAPRARAAGIDDYVTKPVQLQVLKATIDKWLARPVHAPAQPVPSNSDAATSKPSSVDVRVLHKLVGNDAETVRALLAEYLDSSRRLAAEMRAAWTQRDVQTIGAIMHKLKSSSRSVGALGLGDLCAELENAGKTGDNAGVASVVAKFDPVFASVEASITDLLADR